jgi:hypothetical protein
MTKRGHTSSRMPVAERAIGRATAASMHARSTPASMPCRYVPCGGEGRRESFGHVARYWLSLTPPDPPHVLRRMAQVLPSAPLAPHWAEGEQVAEKQAELIQFLLQRLRHVSRELLRGRARGHADGKSSSEWQDLERTLAAHAEAAHAAAVERDEAVAEARAAAAAAAAREAELASAQSTQQQLVDEVARYRAMLTEWSHINAKLELKVRSLEHIQNAPPVGSVHADPSLRT